MFGAPHIECLQCPVDMTTLWQAFKIDCAFFIGFDKLHDCVAILISKLIIGLSDIFFKTILYGTVVESYNRHRKCFS